MAPLTPETRAKLPAMIDAGPRRRESARRRPDGRRAGRQVRRNLQGRLRRSDGRSRHRAGPDADQSRAIPTIRRRCAACSTSTDKPVLAFGRIAQNASEISRKYQSRDRRAVHPRPAGDRARAAEPRPLRGDAAARRGSDAGAARARRTTWTARPSTRCSRRMALTVPKSALAQDRRTRRRRTPPGSAFRSR